MEFVGSGPNYRMGNEVIFTGLKLDTLPVRVRRTNGELLTVQDVVRRCGKGFAVVYYRVARGMLPERVRIGRRWYWRASQLEDVRRCLDAPLPPHRNRHTPPRKLNAEQERELLLLWKAGHTQRELAKRVGLSQGQVSRILKGRHTPAS